MNDYLNDQTYDEDLTSSFTQEGKTLELTDLYSLETFSKTNSKADLFT